MYSIDSMYEAMVDAVLDARAEDKSTRWMAAACWWLGRQQILSAQAFWFALAAKITSSLPDADREALRKQLSRTEDEMVESATDWPETPDIVTRFLDRLQPPELDLEDLRAEAVRKLDASAERYRQQFLTPGTGQAMAYQQKLSEARAKIANSSIPDSQIPHIVAEADATGMTKTEKAEQIVAIYEQWQGISATIDGKRAAAKVAIEKAETPEAMRAASEVNWS